MNSERFLVRLAAAQLVLVAGPSRSGVSLASAQLATSRGVCLLDAPADLLTRWVEWRGLAVPPPPDFATALQKCLVEIHGPQVLDRSIDHLVLPLRLRDWPHVLQLARAIGARHLVLIERQPLDMLCSLARFPHFQPHLPCPRQSRSAFMEAALQLLHKEQVLLDELKLMLQSDGVASHHLCYEQLVTDSEVLVELCLHLGFVSPGSCSLAGISPSLCFRERPLDQGGVDRGFRQLSAGEIGRLGISALTSPRKQPNLPDPADPLIFTGRGGSGTRLLADAVISQGIDLGTRLNASSDSIQWADLLYEMALSALKGYSTPWSGSWSVELHHRARCLSMDRPFPQTWGFKLPEAMLVLEPLLKAWPECRVVHLVRHPLDTCLRRTHMTSRITNPVGKALLEQAYRTLGRLHPPEDDPPHLRNAVSWWYQLREMQRVRECYSARIIELRFEDLCDHPERITHKLMRELDLPSRPFALEVDSSRRRRWSPGDERIGEVWELCGPLAETYGYSDQI